MQSASTTATGDVVHGRVLVAAEVLTDDDLASCAALQRAGLDAECRTLAEIRARVRRRQAPACLVVDMRSGRAARSFLDAYCRTISRNVVVISDLADTPSRLAAIEVGAADHIVAPFDEAEMVARVRRVVSRTRNVRASGIRVGDLVIEPVRRTVMRGGSQVDLTTREWGVLTAVLRAAPRVVSKDELLRDVWGGAARTANLVEATVSSLRRKLERHGARVIHTKHGYGYWFRSPSSPVGEGGDARAEREQLVRERDAINARHDRAIAVLRKRPAETAKDAKDAGATVGDPAAPGEDDSSR